MQSLQLLCFVFRGPYVFQNYGVGVIIYESLLTVFVISNFGLATFMDPGIYPQGLSADWLIILTTIVSLCRCFLSALEHNWFSESEMDLGFCSVNGLHKTGFCDHRMQTSKWACHCVIVTVVFQEDVLLNVEKIGCIAVPHSCVIFIRFSSIFISTCTKSTNKNKWMAPGFANESYETISQRGFAS